jgi:hypothetical protein
VFTVESGVPLPAVRRGKYNFGRLAVTDSMFIPRDGLGRRQHMDNVRNSAKAYGKRHEMKFTTRSSLQGIRVWRIQ